MLKNITLKIKSKITGKPVIITPGRIVVVVGPNSSGKSKFLSELANVFSGGLGTLSQKSPKHLVVDGAQVSDQAEREFADYIISQAEVSSKGTYFAIPNGSGSHSASTLCPPHCITPTEREQFVKDWIAGNPEAYSVWAYHLRGTMRHDLLHVHNLDTNNKKEFPLYSIGSDRVQLNIFLKLFYDAVGQFVLFDFTTGHIRIKLSQTRVPDEHQFSASPEAREFAFGTTNTSVAYQDHAMGSSVHGDLA